MKEFASIFFPQLFYLMFIAIKSCFITIVILILVGLILFLTYVATKYSLFAGLATLVIGMMIICTFLIALRITFEQISLNKRYRQRYTQND
jgi:hypothetical protein